METVNIDQLLQRQISQSLGHLIYVVRDEAIVFYVGQSKRDVIERFWEHLTKPSRLGQLIASNRPQSLAWTVQFWTLADCRPFVQQKRLFADQEWERFDMDMAERALIEAFRPVLNRDFNLQPTPLPAHYRGQQLGATSPTGGLFGGGGQSQSERVWLNRMRLAGWVTVKENGRLLWQHRSGVQLNEADMAAYRHKNQLPPLPSQSS